MSWRSILGVQYETPDALIHSHNSQNRPFSSPNSKSANNANVFANSENQLAEQPLPTRCSLETDFEERAAIIQYEAGVPRDWAEGYARLLCIERPEAISPRRWQQILDDGGYFLERWARQAAQLDWSLLEVFGVSPKAPEHRLDMLGLVPSLCGCRVVMLTAEAATIQAGPDHTLRIFRRVERGGRPIWELGDGG